jgi:hypothetical protein
MIIIVFIFIIVIIINILVSLRAELFSLIWLSYNHGYKYVNIIIII